jgi:hypothetical protein
MRIVPCPTRPRVWRVYRELKATNEEYEALLAFVRAWGIAMRVGGSGEPDLALELGPMSETQELAFAQAYGRGADPPGQDAEPRS